MIALYKGRSFPSRVIRVFNWSDYSHAAWVDDDDDSVIEAWQKGGVSHVANISINHTPGTDVDLFAVTGETPEIRAAVRELLRSQVGKGYDFLGILGFVCRAPILQRRSKWFCSELIAEAYSYAGHQLIRLPSYKIYPGMLAASPMLRHTGGTRT